MSEYGIYKSNDHTYRARVPTLKKGVHEQLDFSKYKHIDPKAACIAWRDKRGEEIWGAERWNYIVTTRSIRLFWGRSVVSVCPLGKTWHVYWRDNGKPSYQIFKQEDEARAFAKTKKTELAFSAKTYMKNLDSLGKYKVNHAH